MIQVEGLIKIYGEVRPVDGIPQYLWHNWKDELSRKGFSWQRFFKVMKYRTDDMILWVYERQSWEDFVKKIIASTQGPLGEIIKERDKKAG